MKRVQNRKKKKNPQYCCMHAVGERSDPLAELGGDQSASWPLLTMQKLHKMNSNFDTVY